MEVRATPEEVMRVVDALQEFGHADICYGENLLKLTKPLGGPSAKQ